MDSPPRPLRRMIILDSPPHRLRTLRMQFVSDLEERLEWNEQGERVDSVGWLMLTEELDVFLEEAVTRLGARPQDRMGVVINGRMENGEYRNIAIPFTPAGLLTTETLLDTIQTVLQSFEVLLIDQLEFTFTLRTAQSPQRAALQGTTNFRGDWNAFVVDKRSILRINPPEDNVNRQTGCWSQWMVLGITRLMFQERLPLRPPYTKKSYHRVAKSSQKFQLRHTWSRLLEDEFPQCSGNATSQWSRIEDEYQVYFALWTWDKGYRLLYPSVERLPFTDLRPVIHGFVTVVDNVWTHVDLLTNPCSLRVKDDSRLVRFCSCCFTMYTKNRQCTFPDCNSGTIAYCPACHVCSQKCTGCHRMDCESQGTSVQRCGFCKCIVQSDECLQLHTPLCPSRFKLLCDLCSRRQHPGLECNEYTCRTCGRKRTFTEPHSCFIQTPKLAKCSERIAVYDFECALDEEQVHRPYLCTVWFPYGLDTIDALKEKYPHQFCQGVQGPVFYFWGLGDAKDETEVYECFKMICDPLVENTVWFAHNAKSYDSVFIKCHMNHVRRILSEDITRGQKILQMSFPTLNVTFRDSISFLPIALRNMSKEFGIEEFKKGHFPHSIITTEYLLIAQNLGYRMPVPPLSAYPLDFAIGTKGKAEAEECEVWYNETMLPSTCFNVRTDAIAYCISDTVLLGKTLCIFREQLMEMTERLPRQVPEKSFATLDPLQYVTLPSAMMRFFLSQMCPPNTIEMIDSNQVLTRQMEDEWIQWKQYRMDCVIQRNTTVRNIPVTGSTEQDAFLFWTCVDNGCPHCCVSTALHPMLSIPFHVLFDSSKETRLELERYVQVHVMYECQWKQLQLHPEYKTWRKQQSGRIERFISLNPRDAYRGGKVEFYKLRYTDSITMVDFVSQYPTTMLGDSFDPFSEEMLQWPMPTGTLQRVSHPEQVDWNTMDALGVCKVNILCPRALYAPFLGLQVQSVLCPGGYEVLYGCCRTCMIQRSVHLCEHDEDERAFVGTWTCSEIRYACSIGYRVIDTLDCYTYSSQSSDLFRSFIVPFMKEKICSKRKGIVTADNQWTDQGVRICEYLTVLTGVRPTMDEFVDAPARRYVAKLAMNSFTGKWGQCEVHKSTRTFDEFHTEDSQRLFQDPRYSILSAQVLDESGSLIHVEYEDRRGSHSGFKRKNDLIIAHITAYGRMMLHRLEHRLGRQLLYVDTDSAFHKYMDAVPYTPGFRTGDLEKELPLAMNWTACGRKFYAYQNIDETYVAKQKGVSLKQSMSQSFTSESLYRLIYDTYQAFGQDDAETIKRKRQQGDDPAINVNQTLFITQQHTPIEWTKQTRVSRKQSLFRIEAMKRNVCWPNSALEWDTLTELDTLPFGYNPSD